MTTLLPPLVDRAMEAAVVPSFTRIGYEARRRLFDWDPLEGFDLSDRLVVVTGAGSGLGHAVARRLAELGARLHLMVRSEEKGADARRRIIEATSNDQVTFDVADLAALPSVEAFAERLLEREDRLHALVNNAGAMFDTRMENPAGIELTVAVHVVGPFLLTTRLLPALRASEHGPGRVVTVSSGGMYAERLDVQRLESPHAYRPTSAYARAKRAQVVLNQEWARRADDDRVVFHAMHPGWADTRGIARSLPGFRTFMAPLLRDADQGADTAVWLVAAPEASTRSGTFWHDRLPRSTHRVPWTRNDPGDAQRLWEHVVAAAGVRPFA